jgi:transcriptional regulator with XRE-family HTH domain
VATQLGWPRSKISKMENGRQMPAAADVTAWATACGHPEAVAELLDALAEAETVHRQYRHQLRRGHAGLQQDFDRLVREAKRIRNAEVTVIPGLLQTADYARYRMLEAVRTHDYPADGVEAAVAARMRRQEVLYDTDREFEFVITEAALRLLLCPAQVMLGQVDRLTALSGLGNISLGIIPFDVVLPVAPMHGFLITDDLTTVELHVGEDFTPGRESAAYEAIADALMAEAVTGDEARRLLAAAAERLRDLNG